MAAILGIVKIKVDGKLQRSLPGAKLQVGGYDRTSSVGHKRYGAYRTFIPSKLDFSVAKTADLDVRALKDLEGATLIFEGDDGRSYLVPNVDCVSGGEISDGGAGVSFSFEGDPAEDL